MPRGRRSILSWLPPAAVLVLCVLAAVRLLGPGRKKPEPAAPDVTVNLYFHRSDQPEGQPLPVRRTLEPAATAADRLRMAVEALLAGPTPEEKGKGYFTSLPAGSKLLGVRVSRPYAYLNLNAKFEQTGGTARIEAMLEQLSYTAASIPGLKGVILQIEGRRVGTAERPFTGGGLLFRSLHPPAGSAWAKRLGPEDALDLFLVTIPDQSEMWQMMGPEARRLYGEAAGIDTTAFAEGLGSWRNYRVASRKIKGDEAIVTITGRQVLEGNVEPNARYEARMIREDGRWKWNGGKRP